MKNKLSSKIIITAGPTWVPIDSVRIITSCFSGETGLEIARCLSQKGAKVDLLMGPGRAKITNQDEKQMNINRFFYYEELDNLLQQKVMQQNYDVVIHSSAVADYTPIRVVDGKIASQQNLNIELKPTEKLIDKIKLLSPQSFLVKFKLQVGLNKEELLDIAYSSLKQSKANLIVANDLKQMNNNQYIAYIMQPDKSYERVNNKLSLAQRLSYYIEKFSKK